MRAFLDRDVTLRAIRPLSHTFFCVVFYFCERSRTFHLWNRTRPPTPLFLRTTYQKQCLSTLQITEGWQNHSAVMNVIRKIFLMVFVTHKQKFSIFLSSCDTLIFSLTHPSPVVNLLELHLRLKIRCLMPSKCK